MIWFFVLVLLAILVIGGILTIVGVLIYCIPEALGYPKIATWLTWIYVAVVGFLAFTTVFEDELFSKKDATKLLAKQDIHLMDDFGLVKNRSEHFLGDYCHTFTLRISTNDRQRIIQDIKSSRNFKAKGDSIINLRIKAITLYEGPNEMQDSESEKSFVRELFKPNGKKIRPTYRRIIIDKKENILVFEDIIL